MLPSVDDIVKLLKLPTTYVVAFVISSGFLLLANENLLELVGLKGSMQSLRPIAGIVFLISISIVLVLSLKSIYNRFVLAVRAIRGFIRLHNLTKNEQDILQLFILDNNRTYFFIPTDGDVSNLEHLRILYQASSYEHRIMGISYGISGWAWRYLHWFPKLLGESRVEKLKHRIW